MHRLVITMLLLQLEICGCFSQIQSNSTRQDDHRRSPLTDRWSTHEKLKSNRTQINGKSLLNDGSVFRLVIDNKITKTAINNVNIPSTSTIGLDSRLSNNDGDYGDFTTDLLLLDNVELLSDGLPVSQQSSSSFSSLDGLSTWKNNQPKVRQLSQTSEESSSVAATTSLLSLLLFDRKQLQQETRQLKQMRRRLRLIPSSVVTVSTMDEQKHWISNSLNLNRQMNDVSFATELNTKSQSDRTSSEMDYLNEPSFFTQNSSEVLVENSLDELLDVDTVASFSALSSAGSRSTTVSSSSLSSLNEIPPMSTELQSNEFQTASNVAESLAFPISVTPLSKPASLRSLSIDTSSNVNSNHLFASANDISASYSSSLALSTHATNCATCSSTVDSSSSFLSTQTSDRRTKTNEKGQNSSSSKRNKAFEKKKENYQQPFLNLIFTSPSTTSGLSSPILFQSALVPQAQRQSSDSVTDTPTARSAFMSPAIQNVITALLVLMIVITIVGNTLVCLSPIYFRKLRHPSNYLLISLALSDLSVALLVMPFALYKELQPSWLLGDLLCDVWLGLDVVCCTASILHLCVICIDRYLTITRPFTYAVKRRTGRSLFLIFCVWMLSAFICLPPLLVLGNEHGTLEAPICEYCKNFAYQLYATLGAFYIPLLVMLVLYYKIYEAAKRVVEAELKSQASCTSVQPLTVPQMPLIKPLSDSALATTAIAGNGNSSGDDINNERSSPGPFVRFQQSLRLNSTANNNAECLICGRKLKVSAVDQQSTTMRRRRNQIQDQKSAEQRSKDGCALPLLHSDKIEIKTNVLISADIESRSVEPNNNNKNFKEIDHDISSTCDQKTVEQALNNETIIEKRLPSNEDIDFIDETNSHSAADVAVENPSQPSVDTTSLPVKSRLSRTFNNLEQNVGHNLLQLHLDNVCSNCSLRSSQQEAQQIRSNESNSPAKEIEKIPVIKKCTFKSKESQTKSKRKVQKSDQTLENKLSSNSHNVLPQNLLGESHSSSLQVPNVVAGNTITAVSGSSSTSAAVAAVNRKLNSSIRERKASITLGVIMCAFIICWLPFFILALFRPFMSERIPDWTSSLTLWLGYVNSMLNPIIYVTFHQDFRRAFKYILLCRCKVMKSSMRKEAYNVQYG